MTKLTYEQHDQLAIISNLYNKRRTVRADVMKELDVLVVSRTERINVDLHEAVRKAVASGTPARRIGMAIGTSANRTWTELINESLANPAPDVEVIPPVDYGDDQPHVEVRRISDTFVGVYLDNYALDGDVVNGEVEFAWSDTDEEWFVQGDGPLDFAVERALFGAEPDASLRAEFDRVVK